MDHSTEKTGLILSRFLPIQDLTDMGPFNTFLVHDGSYFSILKTLKDSFFLTYELRTNIMKSISDWEGISGQPHTVSTRQSGMEDGNPYLLVEYIATGTRGYNSLARCFRDSNPGIRRTLRWFSELALTLNECFRRNPDALLALTPRNVLIGADDRVKISNFGGLYLSDTMRYHEIVPATHMAPEQHEDIRNCTVQTVMYQIGILLYQAMNGGSTPFNAEPPHDDSRGEVSRYHDELQKKRMNRQYHAFLRGDNQHSLYSLIEHCLDPNPRGRYGSFHELDAELRRTAALMNGIEFTGHPLVPEDHWDTFNHGVACYQHGRFEEAITSLTKLTNEIDHPYAWLFLGLSRNSMNDPHEAIGCLRKAASAEQDTSDFWYHLGTILHENAYTQDAIDCLENAAFIDPEDTRVTELLGRIHTYREDYTKALEHFEKLAGTRKKDWRSWHDKGHALAQLGYHDKALACFENALLQQPESPELLEKKAECLLHMGAPGKAADIYREITGLKNVSPGSWTNFGDCHHDMGNFDQAVACYDKALEQDPGNISVIYKKGRAIMSGGDYARALRMFDRILDSDPADIFALNSRGICHANMGNFNRALDSYRAALAVNPDDIYVLKNMSDCYLKLHDFHAATECLDRALVIEPNNMIFIKQKGLVFQTGEDFMQASTAYVEYLKHSREDADAWLNAGICLYNLGAREQALECFERSIEIDHDQKKAILYKADVEKELSIKEKAISTYIHYISLSPRDTSPYYKSAKSSLDEMGKGYSAGTRFTRMLCHEAAKRTRHLKVLPAHILISMLQTKKTFLSGDGPAKKDPDILAMAIPDCIEFKQVLITCNLDPDRLSRAIRNRIGSGGDKSKGIIYLDPSSKAIFRSARSFAGKNEVRLKHMLAAIMYRPDEMLRTVFRDIGIDTTSVINAIINQNATGTDPDKAIIEAKSKLRGMEMELSSFMSTLLEAKLGPGWENEVEKYHKKLADRKKIRNNENRAFNISINIIDAATIGEKKDIILHKHFWHLFREVFSQVDNDKFTKPFIEDRFAKINRLHVVDSHPQPFDESIIVTGLGAFTEIIDMIMKYKNR